MSHCHNTNNDDDDDGSPTTDPPPPSSSTTTTTASGMIAYTRQRNKFTKTRNAASSARFRQNKSRAGIGVGGGGKEDESWFARKSAGWTDDAIRSHLVGGRGEEDGFGMIGDVIQGVGVGTTTTNNDADDNDDDDDDDAGHGSKFLRRKKSRNNNRRMVGMRFAWEEEEENVEEQDTFGGQHREDTDGGSIRRGIMAPPPPTLMDIMDEQDEIDFASRSLRVQHQQHFNDGANGEGEGESESGAQQSRRKRRKNAALEELARISSGTVEGGCKLLSTGGSSSGGGSHRAMMDGSIGYRLLKALGYRSRLGVAIVPYSFSGRRQGQQQQQSIDAKGNNDNIENIDDSMLLSKELSSRELSKWLLSRGLRAVRLPSISHDKNDDRNCTATTTTAEGELHQNLLTIPPPKLDRHGIGYDPFANAPEFREFRERQLARARMLGRDKHAVGNDGNGSTGMDRRRTKMSRGEEERYFTNNLKEDGRRALWDKQRSHENDSNLSQDSDDDFDDVGGTQRRVQQSQQQQHHYAADRDYSDFVGTKSSSGFALEEDDDADVYNHDDTENAAAADDDGGHRRGGEYYMTEVQSPVASDAEDNEEEDGGRAKRSRRANKSNDNNELDTGTFSEVWNAWGTDGINTGRTDTTNLRTTDGKPPLAGFVLGKNANSGSSGNDAPPVRWTGPVLPSGYVLKRHVFRDEGIDSRWGNFVDGITHLDRSDCGLGLNFQRRLQTQRRPVPIVLPSSFNQQTLRPTTTNTTTKPPGKMLARDGTELNFHAVRESMKSRFVTSSVGSTDDDDARRNRTTTAVDDDAEVETKNLDEEEWINITITPWIPTRLLCKRWGVPEGMTAECLAGEAVAGGTTNRMRSNEETYFRDMVYDPAVADRCQRDGGIKEGITPLPSIVDRELALTTALYDDDESNDITGFPPPTRPSTEIFRSIFDADESDMDISSSSSASDEDEVEEVEYNDVGKDAVDGKSNNTDPSHEAGKHAVDDGVTHTPAARNMGGVIDKVIDEFPSLPIQQDEAESNASDASSFVSSTSSKSGERQKRHHHHHHRRRRRRSRRDESSGEESHNECNAKRRKKEKKKKHHSSKHHRSRSRHRNR
jgi:hypothetical protein